MIRLNLPPFEYKISEKDSRTYIFDEYRRKLVALTPEEWVRQHFCHYLVDTKGFPAGRLTNEYAFLLNGRQKRCDTVIFDLSGQPQVICEYKAPNVPITQAVVEQIARYNLVLKVPYLILSNGLCHYACRVNYTAQSTRFLPDIPFYTEL